MAPFDAFIYPTVAVLPHRARTIDQQRTSGTPATHTCVPRLGQLAAPTIEEAGASDSAYVALNLKLLRNPGLVNPRRLTLTLNP